VKGAVKKTMRFAAKPMWGRMESCARLTTALDGSVRQRRQVSNPPQVANLLHNGFGGYFSNDTQVVAVLNLV
jgi:hypothetical protein